MIFVFLMAEKSTLSRKFPIVSTDVPTALSWTAQAEYISAKGKGTHNFQTFPSMQYTMKKFRKKEKKAGIFAFGEISGINNKKGMRCDRFSGLLPFYPLNFLFRLSAGK